MKEHENVYMDYSRHPQLPQLKMDKQKMGEGKATRVPTMEGKAGLEPGMQQQQIICLLLLFGFTNQSNIAAKPNEKYEIPFE